jgi:hypothetical protein
MVQMNAHKVLAGRPVGKNQSEDLEVDGRIILKWILRKKVGRCRLDSADSSINGGLL